MTTETTTNTEHASAPAVATDYKKYTNTRLLKVLLNCHDDDGKPLCNDLSDGTVRIRHDGIDNVIEIVLELISRTPFIVDGYRFCEYFHFSREYYDEAEQSMQVPDADGEIDESSEFAVHSMYGVFHGIYYVPSQRDQCTSRYTLDNDTPTGCPVGVPLVNLLINDALYSTTDVLNDDDMSDFDSVVENARHLSDGDYDDSYCNISDVEPHAIDKFMSYLDAVDQARAEAKTKASNEAK